MMNRVNFPRRIWEILPGLLTWLTLTSPIWLSRPLPLLVAFFLTFLVVFWVYRALLHAVGLFVGYFRYRRESKVDWYQRCQKLRFRQLPQSDDLPASLAELKHFILIPVNEEGYEVLKPTLTGIAASNFPRQQVLIVLTIEEKGAETILADLENIKAELAGRLGEVLMFVHPAGREGEVKGAASNRSWGARQAVALLRQRGEDLDNCIFTTHDADCIVSPQFIPRLTYAYLTSTDRRHRFFQTAIHLYDNNLWEVPSLMRVQANSVTLAVLSSWVFEADYKDTWSCYSVPLSTLLTANFWDVSLAIDDTPFYWRAFFALDGRFKGETFYISVSSDAVLGRGFVDSHLAQYKQLVRWGWGVIVFPLAMEGFLKFKNIAWGEKLARLFKMLEQYIIWRTVTFLVAFGFPIFLFFNPIFKQSTIGINLPRITGFILTLALLLLIPVIGIRERLVQKKPGDWPWWKKWLAWLEGPLVILNLLTYVFVPYLEAETRLMLGRRIELWWTPKVRK